MTDYLDVDLDAPPAGTAVVRPLRHVQAVRQRSLEQLAARSLGAESRTARAWSWALGDTPTAPVSDRPTDSPPRRADVESEIAVADERRLSGSEIRADGAATVLRWLIGDDDHVPVRSPNRGELVGGFGDVVRSHKEIANLIANMSLSIDKHMRGEAAADALDIDWRVGVIAALRWTNGEAVRAPVSASLKSETTTHDLKLERLHAQGMIDRPGEISGDLLSIEYCRGVIRAITWLLGDRVVE
jgi:hypothetical protein